MRKIKYLQNSKDVVFVKRGWNQNKSLYENNKSQSS